MDASNSPIAIEGLVGAGAPATVGVAAIPTSLFHCRSRRRKRWPVREPCGPRRRHERRAGAGDVRHSGSGLVAAINAAAAAKSNHIAISRPLCAVLRVCSRVRTPLSATRSCPREVSRYNSPVRVLKGRPIWSGCWTTAGPYGPSRTLRRHASMPFIITDPCIETKDTACVDVCPSTASTRARTNPSSRRRRCSTSIRRSASTVARACRPALWRRFTRASTRRRRTRRISIEANAIYRNGDADTMAQAEAIVKAHVAAQPTSWRFRRPSVRRRTRH